jgi:hypothetical protein
MTSFRVCSLLALRALVCAGAGFSSAAASGQTLATLHQFNGADGAATASRLIAGPGGVLYGATPKGGAIDCGTIFSLTPPATAGGTWAFKLLYDFPEGQAACTPIGALQLGAGGQLYGAAAGGASNSGAVFELDPPATEGAPWQFQTLHAFTYQGIGTTPPDGGPVIDANGVLYGTLGTSNGGAVYALTPPATKGGAWTETLIFTGSGTNNSNPAPFGSLLAHAGGLTGIACPGTGQTCNLISLSPPTGNTGAWTSSVLLGLPYNATVNTDLVADSNGNLFGTSPFFGAGNTGDVFELSPPATAGQAWTYKEIFAFAGGFANGGEPTAGVTFDANGALWGVAATAGTDTSIGLLYSLTPPTSSQGTWTYQPAYSFTGGKDGGVLAGGLVLGADGGLYGATNSGGVAGGQLFPTFGYSKFGYGTLFGYTP